jgi:putative transposase
MIESINRILHKITKNRTIFPNDKAALKLVYMALKNILKNGLCQLEIGL